MCLAGSFLLRYLSGQIENFMNLLLQAGGDPTTNMFFLLAMVGVFIFMIVLPQRKRTKEQKTFMSELDRNQDVVTASGILGKIIKIEDEIVTLEVDSKTHIRVTKNAISKELTHAIFPKKA